ncbi:MAG: hypothetical protein WED00_17660 [Aquisalimonadaceae bacterium]
MKGLNLRELDRDQLLALQEAVERELDNRQFEERLRWEARRMMQKGPEAIDGTAR